MVLCIFRSFLPIPKKESCNLGIWEKKQRQSWNRSVGHIILKYGQCYPSKSILINTSPPPIYPLLFQYNIPCLDDFKHKTANDLYHICQEDYSLTMRFYFILRENGIVFNNWEDKYIFEILPKKSCYALEET